MVWGGHGHNHWHVHLGASYELRNAAGEVVRKYEKVGYCFFDQLRLPAAPTPEPRRFAKNRASATTGSSSTRASRPAGRTRTSGPSPTSGSRSPACRTASTAWSPAPTRTAGSRSRTRRTTRRGPRSSDDEHRPAAREGPSRSDRTPERHSHAGLPLRGIESLAPADDGAIVRPLRLLPLALLLLALPLALLASAHAAGGASAAATVSAHASSRSIPASGRVPGGTSAISLNTGIGEREGAWIVVTGAGRGRCERSTAAPSARCVELAWGHFVRSTAGPSRTRSCRGTARRGPRSGRTSRSTCASSSREEARPGIVPGSGRRRAPTAGRRRCRSGSRLPGRAAARRIRERERCSTSFHSAPRRISTRPQGSTASRQRAAQRRATGRSSPGSPSTASRPSSWGFGEPRSTAGYAGSRKWWLDSASEHDAELEGGGSPRCASRSRTTASAAAGRRASTPDARDLVRLPQGRPRFWRSHGWLGDSVPTSTAWTSRAPPGSGSSRARRERLHSCFPGGRQLMTGRPTANNRYLWDGRNGDDLDIWVVLLRRWYGRFTVPARSVTANRARENLHRHRDVRRRGKDVWSYLYTGVAGTPGFRALEPLSNPRMFLLWNALEGHRRGPLRPGHDELQAVGEPARSGRPRRRASSFSTPGAAARSRAPASSRSATGSRTPALFRLLRSRQRAPAVRRILGGAGLFSAGAKGVRLACNIGCELKSRHAYAWPLWSHDASTPGRIESAKAQLLARLAR